MAEPLAPFGVSPAELSVLGRSLAETQDRAVAEAGLGPIGDSHTGRQLVLGDHTWVTPELLRRFVAVCPEGGGQLAIRGPFADFSASLQDLPEEGALRRLPVAIAGGPVDAQQMAALPAVEVDLAESIHKMPDQHPAWSHATNNEIPVTDAMAHTVSHWSHLMRVNLLAFTALFEGHRRRFDAAPWWRKAIGGAKLVAKARSVNPWRLARALGDWGKGCNVHPTATVEASVLGDGVEIGPHAVVRGCWLGDGVRVAEHARMNLTVAHEGAQFARGVMANLCVLLEGAYLSQGWGFQACLLGREAFVAMGACFYDLSFGGPIKVMHRGQRVSSGTHFMGVCVGDRAKVAPNVIVSYGETIPNDAFLIADPGRIFRRIPAELPQGPVLCIDGAITPWEAVPRQ